MCIRCRQADPTQPKGYCAACAVNERLEVFRGFGSLESYLASWAAFGEWLSARDSET